MRTFFAPGRINLIGEHIDYNGGLVLPATISLGIKLTVEREAGNLLRLKSQNKQSVVEINVAEPISYDKAHGWANYPKAALSVLQSKKIALPSGDFSYSGNLPMESGLSSSACMEVLTAYATRILAREVTDRTVLAVESQRAENDFIGVPCGIMDQFAIANGRAGNAILLDCETLDFEYVPIALGEYELVIINSNKPRQLIGSDYQDRRGECEQALSFIRRYVPDLKNLCQATNEMISDLPSTALRKRVFHAITENKRVEEAKKALVAGNLSQFGELLQASHNSLRDNYEVTGYELDALAEAANGFTGCLGARMTGAGFGGCLIAIVASPLVADFQRVLTDIYTRKTSLFPSFYTCEIVDGVMEIDTH